MSSRVVIVGGGPTGLGAAWRLCEHGHEDWDLYEAGGGPGGLSRSVVDDHGFTWDLGGHVLFSHYQYFDAMMNAALGAAWITHARSAWIHMRERWVPYPLQYNVWRLPEEECLECVYGVLDAVSRSSDAAPDTFREWLMAQFGVGLCDAFMFPYNRKVWTYPLDHLGAGWVGERVAPVDLRVMLRGIVHRSDDSGWGPNATFRFPAVGGTGAIWQAVAGSLPEAQVHYARRVILVDLESRRIYFADGTSTTWDYLISTIPLDMMLRMASPGPQASLRSEFVHSSVHVVGVGITGTPPDVLAHKGWIYFPEPNVPFYRATVFSNYSPHNAPSGTWSLMTEVGESSHSPVAGDVVASVVSALAARGLLNGHIVSRWHRRLEYGYPTPWRQRDEVLGEAEAFLRSHDVFSRGRFGAWKYEVSNQDHSVMQGVEAVDNILLNTAERTYGGDMSDKVLPRLLKP